MKEIFTSFFRHICDFLSKRLFNRNFCHAPLKIWFLFLLFICKFQQSLKTIWYKNAFDKWRMSTTHFHLVATNSPWVLSCFWQLSKACGITWWWGNSQLRNWVRYDGGTSNFCLLQSAQPSHGNITPLPHLVDETDKGLRSQRTSRAHAAGGITANRQTRQKCSEFHSWRVSRLSSIKIKFIFDIRTNLTTKHASVTSRVGKPDSLS